MKLGLWNGSNLTLTDQGYDIIIISKKPMPILQKSREYPSVYNKKERRET